MSEHDRTAATCPFEEILDRRVLGDATEEDKARLAEHLRAGCPSCEQRWRVEEKLEALIHGALDPIKTEIDDRKDIVLGRLREKIAREEDRWSGRRRRRVGMNTLLMLILMLGIVLISVQYVMYARLHRKLVKAQTDAAETEIRAILSALARLGNERGTDSVPSDVRGLVLALSQHRKDSERPYYAPDPGRIDPKDGVLLDPWGKAYVYKRSADGVFLYSPGPNGRDESGAGDDVGVRLILPR